MSDADCPLCELSQDEWDVIGPVVDHDDLEEFQLAQMGPAERLEVMSPIWSPTGHSEGEKPLRTKGSVW
jgi:hypothetical protein